jgi:hypothetical protein
MRITLNIRKLREMIYTIGDSALSRLRTEDICRGGASLGASKSEDTYGRVVGNHLCMCACG